MMIWDDFVKKEELETCRLERKRIVVFALLRYHMEGL